MATATHQYGPSFQSLTYLTAADNQALRDCAQRTTFSPQQLIVQQDLRTRSLYAIESGAVRVEQQYLGQTVVISCMAEGDVFGEMSFLEDSGASASIVADCAVTLLCVPETALRNLLESVPGFAARFYHSLAALLSQRLRARTSELPPLLVEEVPQVRRFNVTRTGNEGSITAELRGAVEQFKDSMLAADRMLLKQAGREAEVQQVVSRACSALKDYLTAHIRREPDSQQAIGAFVFREAFAWLMLSRMQDRVHVKPRGYAGDYYTIELIYQNEAKGDGRVGKYIDRWILDLPCSQAVRNRRGLVSGFIKQIHQNWKLDAPMPIISLACGPAREVFDILERGETGIHFTGLDIDPEALAFVGDKASRAGLGGCLTLIKENVVRLSRGKSELKLPAQQLIYSIGLIDYLADEFVISLLDWAHGVLLEGGVVMLGNFDVGNPDREYMEHVGEWMLIHRTPEMMRELFSRSRFGKAPVSVVHEAANVNLFASCQKS